MACDYHTTEAQALKGSRCPTCHSAVHPVFVDEDVTCTLNWTEVRCLTNWADAYLKSITVKQEAREVFGIICARLRGLRPKTETADPLTIMEQLGDMHRAQPHMDVSRVGDIVVTTRASSKPTIN